MRSNQPPARLAEYQRAQRRFRRIIGVLATLALIAALLQYSPYALLAERRTETLWGVLVGVVVMGIVSDRRLAAAIRRESTA